MLSERPQPGKAVAASRRSHTHTAVSLINNFLNGTRQSAVLFPVAVQSLATENASRPPRLQSGLHPIPSFPLPRATWPDSFANYTAPNL